MKLQGKLAIVTGGASGLGKATVRQFLSRGMSVAIIDLNQTRGSQLESQLVASYNAKRIRFFRVNIVEENEVKRAIQAIVQYFKKNPQVIVNCAGLPDCNIEVISPDLTQVHPTTPFRKIINVNVWGTINVSKYGALAMAHADKEASGQRGVIINVASVAGSEGTKGQAAYAASKGAIIGGTIPMARSLGKHGIRVVTISPGPIYSGISMSEATKSMARFSALGRFGEPEDFGHLARSIAENYHINATVVRMDGGLLKPHI